MPDANVCVHGGLRRKCDTCEALAEVSELQREVERLRKLIGELYKARGGSRHELTTAIRRTFFAALEVGEQHAG